MPWCRAGGVASGPAHVPRLARTTSGAIASALGRQPALVDVGPLPWESMRRRAGWAGERLAHDLAAPAALIVARSFLWLAPVFGLRQGTRYRGGAAVGMLCGPAVDFTPEGVGAGTRCEDDALCGDVWRDDGCAARTAVHAPSRPDLSHGAAELPWRYVDAACARHPADLTRSMAAATARGSLSARTL